MWLVRDDEVLATAEVAADARARRRGLLGRDEVDGVLVLRPCRHVHTFRMRFAIDVAFCDVNGVVLRTCSLPPGRRVAGRAARRVRGRGGLGRVRTLADSARRPDRAARMTRRAVTVTVAAARLVLVATPIGNLGDLSPRAVEVLRDADMIAAEDTRRTRALLTHAGVPAAGRLRAIHAHNERAGAQTVVDAVSAGKRVAYVTDAGMPGVSDPGERLVRACLDAGLAVEVVPGPSAVLTALVLSGFPTDRFVFEGFLPRRGPARRERIAALVGERRTTVLFEAPNRVLATLSDLLAACGPLREVAVARELTKLYEEVWRGELSDAVGHVGAKEPRGEYVDRARARAGTTRCERRRGGRARAEPRSPKVCPPVTRRARVARDLHVPRRRVYDTATRLRQAMKSQK